MSWPVTQARRDGHGRIEPDELAEVVADETLADGEHRGGELVGQLRVLSGRTGDVPRVCRAVDEVDADGRLRGHRSGTDIDVAVETMSDPRGERPIGFGAELRTQLGVERNRRAFEELLASGSRPGVHDHVGGVADGVSARLIYGTEGV